MTNTSPTRLRSVAMAAIATIAVLAAFSVPAGASGATQVRGQAVPWPVAPETCPLFAHGDDVNYVLAFPEGSGDLTGCLYGWRDGAVQHPGGTVNVLAHEIFDGCLGTACGTFDLTARITSKWDGPPGPPPADQQFGRCQHKIVAGTGTEGFVAVTGRLDFKDIILRDANGDVTGVVFDYRGHLR